MAEWDSLVCCCGLAQHREQRLVEAPCIDSVIRPVPQADRDPRPRRGGGPEYQPEVQAAAHVDLKRLACTGKGLYIRIVKEHSVGTRKRRGRCIVRGRVGQSVGGAQSVPLTACISVDVGRIERIIHQ